jgi:hypothetical protein
MLDRNGIWCLVIGAVLTFALALTAVIILAVWTGAQTPRLDKTGICNDNDPATLDLVIGGSDSATRACQNDPLPSGSSCQTDMCFVDGECTVQNGKPVGLSTGECPDVFYDIYPVECPIPIFIQTVQVDIINTNLYYYRDCWLGLCRTSIMYPSIDMGLLVGLPDPGSEFINTFLSIPYDPEIERKCLDLISDLDPAKYCYKADAYAMYDLSYNSYFFICEYKHRNAHARTLLDLYSTDTNILPASISPLSIDDLSMPIPSPNPVPSPSNLTKLKSMKKLTNGASASVVYQGKITSLLSTKTKAVSKVEIEDESSTNENEVVETKKEKEKENRLKEVKTVPPKNIILKAKAKEQSKAKDIVLVKPKFSANPSHKKPIKAIKAKNLAERIKKDKNFLPGVKRALESLKSAPSPSAEKHRNLFRTAFGKQYRMAASSYKNSKVGGENMGISVHDLEMGIYLNHRADMTESEIASLIGTEVSGVFALQSNNPLKVMDIGLNGTSTPEFIVDVIFEGIEYVEDFNDWLASLAADDDLTSIDIYYAFAMFFGSTNMNEFSGYMLDTFLTW